MVFWTILVAFYPYRRTEFRDRGGWFVLAIARVGAPCPRWQGTGVNRRQGCWPYCSGCQWRRKPGLVAHGQGSLIWELPSSIPRLYSQAPGKTRKDAGGLLRRRCDCPDFNAQGHFDLRATLSSFLGKVVPAQGSFHDGVGGKALPREARGTKMKSPGFRLNTLGTIKHVQSCFPEGEEYAGERNPCSADGSPPDHAHRSVGGTRRCLARSMWQWASHVPDNDSDRAALVAFYQATNGLNWTNKVKLAERPANEAPGMVSPPTEAAASLTWNFARTG